MNLVFKMIMILGVVILSACSTSPKTQVVQMGDNQFTEQQILAELAKLDQAENEVKKKKGLNVTNTAAFLFWLPGLAYTYYDADESLKLIQERRSHLTTLYNQRIAAQTTSSSKV